MSIRWKFALALAGLSAVAAIAASAIGYAETRSQLLGQVDASVRVGLQRAVGGAELAASLRESSDDQTPSSGIGGGFGPPGPVLGSGAPSQRPEDGGRRDPDQASTLSDRAILIQQLTSAGQVLRHPDGLTLPVSAEDVALARAKALAASSVSTIKIGDHSFRIAAAGLSRGGAIQVARPIDEIQSTLNELRDSLILLTLAIVVLAAGVGFLLARRGTQSLEDLTESAEAVAATGTPDARIDVDGNDEIGRLGRSFSQMLASLADSRAQQQRLVQDAGHELRTPLTSMKTNLAVLDRLDRLPDEERLKLLADLRSETGEMAMLVEELVTLSTGGSDEEMRDVDLKHIVERAATRTHRRTGRDVTVTAEDVTINGQPRSLERAIGNLLDNAAKFDPSDSQIEISLVPGKVEVSDRGPGIPRGEETLIFERFHRSVEARNVPGSGLGLAIVEDVAVRHGGKPFARSRDGGGSVIGFTFAD